MSKEDKRKEIRKWIIRGEKDEKALIAVSGRPDNVKVIIKALMKGIDEHLTMLLKPNGYFDFHITKEGRIKTYTPLVQGKIDFQKLSQSIGKLSQKMSKPLDINDPSFRDFTVLIPRSPESLEEFFEKYYVLKGKRMIFPDKEEQKEMAKHLEDYFHVAFLDEITKYKFDFAYATDPKGEHLYFLFNAKGNYLLIALYEIYESFFDAFVPEFKYCPECGTKVAPSKLICPKCRSKFNKTND